MQKFGVTNLPFLLLVLLNNLILWSLQVTSFLSSQNEEEGRKEGRKEGRQASTLLGKPIIF